MLKFYLDLTVIDLSGNDFENIPEKLFYENIALEKVIMENDVCPNKTRNRAFPEKLFEKNVNFKIFRYSVYNKSCDKVIIPPKLFADQNRNQSYKKIV